MIRWDDLDEKSQGAIVDRLLGGNYGASDTLGRAQRHADRGRLDLARRNFRRALVLYAAVQRLGWTSQPFEDRVAALETRLMARDRGS
jgi:hypothetical protein